MDSRNPNRPLQGQLSGGDDLGRERKGWNDIDTVILLYFNAQLQYLWLHQMKEKWGAE